MRNRRPVRIAFCLAIALFTGMTAAGIARAQQIPDSLYSEMKWRMIGPFGAGTCAVKLKHHLRGYRSEQPLFRHYLREWRLQIDEWRRDVAAPWARGHAAHWAHPCGPAQSGHRARSGHGAQLRTERGAWRFSVH